MQTESPNIYLINITLTSKASISASDQAYTKVRKTESHHRSPRAELRRLDEELHRRLHELGNELRARHNTPSAGQRRRSTASSLRLGEKPFRTDPSSQQSKGEAARLHILSTGIQQSRRPRATSSLLPHAHSAAGRLCRPQRSSFLQAVCSLSFLGICLPDIFGGRLRSFLTPWSSSD